MANKNTIVKQIVPIVATPMAVAFPMLAAAKPAPKANEAASTTTRNATHITAVAPFSRTFFQ